MVLPDAIHHNTRCQGILGIGQPFGQVEAAASLLLGWKFLATENLQESSRHLVAKAFGITPPLNLHIVRSFVSNCVSLLKNWHLSRDGKASLLDSFDVCLNFLQSTLSGNR